MTIDDCDNLCSDLSVESCRTESQNAWVLAGGTQAVEIGGMKESADGDSKFVVGRSSPGAVDSGSSPVSAYHLLAANQQAIYNQAALMASLAAMQRGSGLPLPFPNLPQAALSLLTSGGQGLMLPSWGKVHNSQNASISPDSSTMDVKPMYGTPVNNYGENAKYGEVDSSTFPDGYREADQSPKDNHSPASNSSGSSGTIRTEIKKKEGNGREKVFVCNICNRCFGYKHVLQNHERTHTGEKPFECKECHKRFTRDHHLKTHMRLHTGEKPYHCSHCERQFVQVANLRRHLRVHTGERPYACEMCTSKFSDSNQLKAHMLIHKGEKPFECEKCLGRFRRRHHLMHHKCPKGDDFLESPRGPRVPRTPEQFSLENMAHMSSVTAALLGEFGSHHLAGMPPLSSHPSFLDFGARRTERKSREPRRVFRLPVATMTSERTPLLPPSHPENYDMAVLNPLPEQTEPEDLSLPGRARSPFFYSEASFSEGEQNPSDMEADSSMMQIDRSTDNIKREPPDYNLNN